MHMIISVYEALNPTNCIPWKQKNIYIYHNMLKKKDKGEKK